MNFHFNVNMDEIKEYTLKLQGLHRSALPVAIRGTLNDAGFALKKNNMPKIARQTFEEREPNFFKANSRVDAAKGFDVRSMVAEVGFVSSGLISPATNYAVRDLEEQEDGGIIKGRSFKPLPSVRTGGIGRVRSNIRIAKLKAGNVLNANSINTTDSHNRKFLSGKDKKMQQFILASVLQGIGGFVLGGKLLWKVTNLKRVGRNMQFKKQKLYSFKKSGVAKVHATGFMLKAALEVQKEMEAFYVMEATKQFRKAGIMK